jgi:predicted enzyme related to lactoylglutathione lyase
VDTPDSFGSPSYVELCVTDADAARRFYGQLLGWRPSGAAGPGAVETASLGIGIHDGDESAIFEVFFSVDDLDASLDQLDRLGGRRVSAVNDAAEFGRWAECADDQGVRFGLRERRAT